MAQKWWGGSSLCERGQDFLRERQRDSGNGMCKESEAGKQNRHTGWSYQNLGVGRGLRDCREGKEHGVALHVLGAAGGMGAWA